MDHMALSKATEADIPTQADLSIFLDAQTRAQHRVVLEWLSGTDYPTQQQDIIAQRQEGTALWFLKSAKFEQWTQGVEKTLFCPGIPGAGKTMMAAIVIDFLSRMSHRNHVGIAYIFCRYKAQSEQSALSLISALLKQLALNSADTMSSLLELYGEHLKHGSRPALEDCFKLLSACVSRSTTYIVIDALDECSSENGARDQLIDMLFDLQAKNGRVHLLITSRFVPDVTNRFRSTTLLQLDVRASEEDISRFIDGQMSRLPSYVLHDVVLQEKVRKGIVEAANGMFLLVRLYLDSICDAVTPGEVHARLATLRKGPHALIHAYEDAMSRIDGQQAGQRDLARRALRWISDAKRPLDIHELQVALAMERGKNASDPKSLESPDEIVSCCAGLIAVDQESNTVRLVHYTAQEYLEHVRHTIECEDISEDEDADVASVFSSANSIDSGTSFGTNAEVVEEASKELANMLVGDEILVKLYADALMSLDHSTFFRRHRDLLKQFFIELRPLAVHPSQIQTIRALRGQHPRNQVTSIIWSLCLPDILEKNALSRRLQSTKVDRQYSLNQLFTNDDNLEESSDRNNEPEEGVDISDEDLSDGGEDANFNRDAPALQLILKFLQTGAPFEKYKCRLYRLAHPDANLQNALAYRDITILRDFLERNMGSIATGSNQWIGELVNLGYTYEEVSEILLEDMTDSPWIFFEPRRLDNWSIQSSHHLVNCAHLLTESRKAETGVHNQETLPRTSLETELRRSIEELCGLAGIAPVSRDKEKWSGDACFERETSSAMITFGNFGKKADFISILRNTDAALSKLCLAIGLVQQAEFCCDSFTILRTQTIESDKDLVGTSPLQLCRVDFADVMLLHSSIRSYQSSACTDDEESESKCKILMQQVYKILAGSSVGSVKLGVDPRVPNPLHKPPEADVGTSSGGDHEDHAEIPMCVNMKCTQRCVKLRTRNGLYEGEWYFKCAQCGTWAGFSDASQTSREEVLHKCALAVQFLCLGFLSYSQAHVGPIHPFFMDAPQSSFILCGSQDSHGKRNTQGSVISARLYNLTCLADMTKGQVLAFDISMTNTPEEYTPKSKIQTRHDVIATAPDLLDTWGPGSLVMRRDGSGDPTAIVLGGGLIFAQDEERQIFHWAKSIQGKNVNLSSFDIKTKMLIGAAPVTVNENCVIDEDACWRISCTASRSLGTSDGLWTPVERNLGLQAGQYIVGQVSQTWSKLEGLTIKKTRLDPSNEFFLSFLDETWGLQVSICTGIARRVRLRDLIADTISIFVASYDHSTRIWKNLEARYNMDEVLRKGCLRDWLNGLQSDELQYFRLLTRSILDHLQYTGLDRDGKNLTVAWPRRDDPYSCFKIPCRDESYWMRILADSEDCATFAYLSPECLESEKTKCKGPAHFWQNSIALLGTAVLRQQPTPSSTQAQLKSGESYFFGKPKHMVLVKVRQSSLDAPVELVVSLSRALLRVQARFGSRLRTPDNGLREQRARSEPAEDVVILVSDG